MSKKATSRPRPKPAKKPARIIERKVPERKQFVSPEIPKIPPKKKK